MAKNVQEMIKKLSEHIAAHGCKPRALKSPKDEAERAEAEIAWWAFAHKDDEDVKPALLAAGYFDAPTYQEKASRDLWLAHYDDLCDYLEKGHDHLPPQGGEHDALAQWCQRQKILLAKGCLADWQRELLDDIDFPWLPSARAVQREAAFFDLADQYERFLLTYHRTPRSIAHPATAEERRENTLYDFLSNFVRSGLLNEARFDRLQRLTSIMAECAAPAGGSSLADKTLHNAISEALPGFEVQYRAKLGGGIGELDVYVPDAGFAVEFGSWWHHAAALHQDGAKMAGCAGAGIKLVTVFEGVPSDDLEFRGAYEGVEGVIILEKRASANPTLMEHLIREILDMCPAYDGGSFDMARCLADASEFVRANRAWFDHAEEVRAYVAENGCRPPAGTKSALGGIDLGRWCVNAGSLKKAGRLTKAQLSALDEFGFFDVPTYRAHGGGRRRSA